MGFTLSRRRGRCTWRSFAAAPKLAAPVHPRDGREGDRTEGKASYLGRRLRDLQEALVPAASTCTAIMRRAQLLTPAAASHRPFQRFERAYPNELWQMDFKGHFATQAGPRCHPLTVLDDHSRFNLVLAACGDEQGVTVQEKLTAGFERYGLPD